MLIHPWDAGTDEQQWLDFVRSQGFGNLIASGRDRDVPVVVPTQFTVTDASRVVLHLARPNPIWSAIEQNPTVLLSVAGDWAYIPAAWKAAGAEDPRLGIPTTYYGAVQLIAHAQVVDDPDDTAAILREQLATNEPGSDVADPSEHARRLSGIRGLVLTVREVRAKFKYGGNVDDEHRVVVAEQLVRRKGPGDAAALAHLRHLPR